MALGGGKDIFMDREEQEDEQGLRKVMCERRSVGICCRDSPHGEAVVSRMRTFHTVSPGTSVNKAPIDAPEPSQWHHGCCRLVGENARWQEEKRVCPHRRT